MAGAAYSRSGVGQEHLLVAAPRRRCGSGSVRTDAERDRPGGADDAACRPGPVRVGASILPRHGAAPRPASPEKTPKLHRFQQFHLTLAFSMRDTADGARRRWRARSACETPALQRLLKQIASIFIVPQL